MQRPSLSDRHVWKTFRGHSRTFSFAALLLPRSVRTHVANVYLLCRQIDNIADELVLEVGEELAIRELDRLEQDLERTVDGDTPTSWIWPRLHETNRQFPLRLAPIRELIHGARWDLEGRQILETDDLIEYSELVGGTIGEIMLPFLVESVDDVDPLVPAARSLGIAMQITNIVRDVGEDWRTRRRIYLPLSLLHSAGVDIPTMAQQGDVDDAYASVVELLMDHADSRYESARPAIEALHPRARPAIHAAVRMYREIQNEVRANHHDNLTRRAFVPFWRKIAVLASDRYARRRSSLLRPVVVTS
jgi:15-cis-phytoene synthase